MNRSRTDHESITTHLAFSKLIESWIADYAARLSTANRQPSPVYDG
jgi:hypothetical protein